MADVSIFGPNGAINPNFMEQLTSLSAGAPPVNNGDWSQNAAGYQPFAAGSTPQNANGGMDFLKILGSLGGNGQGGAGGSGLGWNLGTINAGIQGIAQLGNLYMGIKQLGLAKDSFNFQKKAYETNLKNQTQSYNTQITDRVNGRSYNTEEERQAALKAALLPAGG
jgi:hypothetical protein